MPLRPVPWATSGGADGRGGAENSVELARVGIYASTQASTGIIEPKDLAVTALPTPGGAVRVQKGTGVIRSTYPGAFGQSYAVQEQSHEDVPVAATGSSGAAKKYVYVLIEDTQFSGQTPESVEDGPYNDYYVTTTLPQNQPYLLLAEINQPKSTATIENKHITDRRKIADPKEQTYMYADPTVVATEEVLTDTTDEGELFPDVGSIKPDIPWWATLVQIEAEWLQVAQDAGDFNGRIWVEWGPYVETSKRERKTQDFAINGNNSDNLDRAYWKVAQEMFVPSNLRDTSQIFFLKGRLLSHSGGNSRPKLDSASGIVLKLRFLQAPEAYEVNE